MSGYQTLNEAYLSVYEGFVPLNRDKYAKVTDFAIRTGERLAPSLERMSQLRNKPFSRFRPGVRKERKQLIAKSKTDARLFTKAKSALDKTDEYNTKKAGALRSMITALSPHNKIVKFQREELEFVLDYLFENGYADNYESAAVIAESMSDEWFEDILCEWDWEHLKKHSLSNQPTHITGKTPPVLKPSDFENPDSDEAKAKKERRKKRGQRGLNFDVR